MESCMKTAHPNTDQTESCFQPLASSGKSCQQLVSSIWFEVKQLHYLRSEIRDCLMWCTIVAKHVQNMLPDWGALEHARHPKSLRCFAFTYFNLEPQRRLFVRRPSLGMDREPLCSASIDSIPRCNFHNPHTQQHTMYQMLWCTCDPWKYGNFKKSH